MSLLKIIFPNRSAKFLTFYHLIGIILIFSQVNISRSKDSVYLDNTTNKYDYISDAIRRYKRQNLNSGVHCELPSIPLHGRYVIMGDSVASYKPGDFATEFRVLEIHCNRGYAISPLEPSIAICINGTWNPPPTACHRTCPSLISTETTTVKCSLSNIPLKKCTNAVMGTRAVLSCKPSYEDYNIQKSPMRVCRANGWSPSTSTCYPTCGIKNLKGKPNIIGAQNVTIGDYPWQIGIYNSVTKAFMCGGSIIEENIILTAAHCVTNYEGVVQPTAQFCVAAGKYFSRYDEPKDLFAQYSNILSIHVPDRYTGRINAFAQDIAVLILETHFTLSERVQPVCIALNDDPSDLSFLSASDIGIVTGWGYTVENGVASDELKELAIPLIPAHKCSSELTESFRRYFTFDKICGGYLNNRSSICSGDSGGALVFKNVLNDRHYVRGIVSTSPATEAIICDANQYSLFTAVERHIEFLRNLITDNQFRMPIECLGDNCQNEENQIEPNLGTTTRSLIDSSSTSNILEFTDPTRNLSSDAAPINRNDSSPINGTRSLEGLPLIPDLNPNEGCLTNFTLDKQYPRHCREVRECDKRASGTYTIRPEHAPKSFEVVCDLETRGGGWTVIQNRFDGTQDFALGQREYMDGFGNLTGEFWLGLTQINFLTGFDENELLIELTGSDFSKKSAFYSQFSVGDVMEGFSLKILGGYSGDAGDSLRDNAGMKFSTKYNNQYLVSNELNCASGSRGGWWYRDCGRSSLNGKYMRVYVYYPLLTRYEGILWKDFNSYDDLDSMQKTRMLVRPKV